VEVCTIHVNQRAGILKNREKQGLGRIPFLLRGRKAKNRQAGRHIEADPQQSVEQGGQRTLDKEDKTEKTSINLAVVFAILHEKNRALTEKVQIRHDIGHGHVLPRDLWTGGQAWDQIQVPAPQLPRKDP
jgi:hypothetical protein